MADSDLPILTQSTYAAYRKALIDAADPPAPGTRGYYTDAILEESALALLHLDIGISDHIISVDGYQGKINGKRTVTHQLRNGDDTAISTALETIADGDTQLGMQQFVAAILNEYGLPIMDLTVLDVLSGLTITEVE